MAVCFISYVPYDQFRQVIRHAKLLIDENVSLDEIYEINFVLNIKNCLRVHNSIPLNATPEMEKIAVQNAIEKILKEKSII